jgi:ADP-ribosyl-[dinitrogen reductase] hydrolase
MTPHGSPDPQIVTRARGALLAQAAGSRFAAGVDGLAAAALARLLGESLAERGAFDATDVARRWVAWMDADGRGLGRTTRRALELIDAGVEPFDAGRRARDLEPGASAGSGAVLRCAPVALRFHDDPDRLIRAATQQAAVTHADPRCVWAAAAVALALRELLHGNPHFADEVLHRLRDRAPRAVLDAIHRAPRVERRDLPLAPPTADTDAVRCLEIAFWVALHERSLEAGLRLLASAGGDVAGNAATAGGLLGARDGEVAIPQGWLNEVADAPGLGALAERLVAAG